MSDLAALNQVAAHANSVGHLIDRCVSGQQTIGTVFLVDANTVATCAHLAVLYADFLPALKVVFPAAQAEYAVSAATFHPKFDRQPACEMARRALKDPVPALALQDHNVVLLTLSSDLAQLQADEKTGFNKKLSLDPLPRIKGLAGAVEELGLALVIQTVSNARKDGVLYITDERNRPLARIFFQDGKIRYAKFGRLVNEFAIYQLFQRPLSGQFFLKTQPEADWQTSQPALERNTDMLLLEAHRRLDETAKLVEKLGGAQVGYVKSAEQVNLEGLPPEIAKFAAKVYPHLDGGTAITELFDVVGLDTYTILSALVELAFSRQVAPVAAQVAPGAVPPVPFELAAYEPLSKWDEVVSLTSQLDGGRAQMRRGNLVGMLKPNDPYHLLHTIMLPYEAAGCPVFKRGKLIGMHCGMLPLDPALHALPGHLQQLMWVESIRLCLNAHADKPASKPQRPSVGMIRPQAASASGKLCPRCQAVMVPEALFCGTCGTAL